MSLLDQLIAAWSYTHLSAAELQQGLLLASSSLAANTSTDSATTRWKSWALTEIVYREHDVLSKAFAIASFVPLVIVMFLSGLASAPCRERRLPALNLLLYLILSVVVNVTCKGCIRSLRPAHPAAGLNYTTIHGMPSDHSQFMAGVAVYLMRRWASSSPQTTSNGAACPRQARSSSSKKAADGQLATVARTREPMPRLLSCFLFSAALVVGVGRVYNGYHTVGQVIVGWAVGCVLAMVCTTVSVQRVLTWVSEKVLMPVMLVCTYWTNAVC